MKKKIVGIVVCMLLCVTVLSVTGNEFIGKDIFPSSNPVSETKNLDMQDSQITTELQKLPHIPEPLAMWFLQFNFDVQYWSGEPYNAGAEFAYDAVTNKYYFYSSSFASNWLYRYTYDPLSNAITLCEPFQVADGTGGFVTYLRDLAYDGTYFYGGNTGSTIYQMDFTFPNPHVVAKIIDSTNTIKVRGIAYDPTGDSGNGVFYVSTFGDPVWVVQKTTGNILYSFALTTINSKYGLAYDDVSLGGPYLWVFDQGSGAGTPQYIHQWKLGSGTTPGYFTPVIYNVMSDFPTMSGVAGGLFFTTDFRPGYATLGGLLQATPDTMFCYEICPYSPCCLEILDVHLVRGSGSPTALRDNIEVVVKNNGCGNLNDIVLTMTFTVDTTRLCPDGSTPFLKPPLSNPTPGVYQKQWTDIDLNNGLITTRKVAVDGWAYFDLVVTLTHPSVPCSPIVTKTGFTGNLLS